MKFSNPNIRYKMLSTGKEEAEDLCSYTVEEWDEKKLLRSFQAVISKTQRISHAPAEIAIEKWCQEHSDELPNDRGKQKINLNERLIQ